MKRFASMLALFAFTLTVSAQPDHSRWDALLQKHVSNTGKVDYKGFKADADKLNQYLETLQNNSPASSWNNDEQLAYWLNLYNAWMVHFVVEEYPVSSPKDIRIDGKSVWKAAAVKVGDKKYSLDHIENSIIRKEFNDARIHFGINCAARSCPKLYNRAFTGENVDKSLDRLTRMFINSPANELTGSTIHVSQIFNWFEKDFEKAEGSVIKFINKYAKRMANPLAIIKYKEYDWSLND